MAHPLWPLFDLAVRTPRLELRYPDDEVVARLADLACEGIHEPGWMPFGVPWTDVPTAELGRNSVQHHWRARAELSPARWALPLAVHAGGDVVGVQALDATDFARLRSVETGSWLGRRFQGRGLGKEMRQAALHLIFGGLAAEEAVSGAWADNAPSLAVSRACGYEENGSSWGVRRGERTVMVRVRMDRARWEGLRRDDVVIDGLEPCLPLLGGAA